MRRSYHTQPRSYSPSNVVGLSDEPDRTCVRIQNWGNIYIPRDEWKSSNQSCESHEGKEKHCREEVHRRHRRRIVTLWGVKCFGWYGEDGTWMEGVRGTFIWRVYPSPAGNPLVDGRWRHKRRLKFVHYASDRSTTGMSLLSSFLDLPSFVRERNLSCVTG